MAVWIRGRGRRSLEEAVWAAQPTPRRGLRATAGSCLRVFIAPLRGVGVGRRVVMVMVMVSRCERDASGDVLDEGWEPHVRAGCAMAREVGGSARLSWNMCISIYKDA